LCGCACAGRDFIAPCKCKGTSKYVHRNCLDHWRAVKVSARCSAYSVTTPPLCVGGCSGIAK
jgi:E3 ubiquitin-protein ligase DOA10